MTEAIASPAAEWSTIATMIFDAEVVAEVVGTQLQAEDFAQADARLLYATTVEAFYADQTIEPLGIAERCKTKLAGLWEVADNEVPDELLRRLLARDSSKTVIDHAAIVKRLSTSRKLLSVANRAIESVAQGQLTPEEVAGAMSSEALAVTSGTLARSTLLDWMAAGSEYAQYLQRLRLAREKGIEMAVYTGYHFIDNFTKGIAPTELCILAGAPGVGKSVVGWKAAEGFASRQMKKPEADRIATLVVSMEMGLIPSSTRLAQSITGIDGMRLREGQITEPEYHKVLREWKARDGLPIYFNYASNFRVSQLRALVVEGIRRYNVGFVVIDHFRQLDTDKYVREANDADEMKVRFLKESIAKDLNVAVLCLAHTIKIGGGSDANRRPRLSDLRGSGQIAANADFVGFMHKPEDDDMVGPHQAELIWEKARHTEHGTAHFHFEPQTMTVR